MKPIGGKRSSPRRHRFDEEERISLVREVRGYQSEKKGSRILRREETPPDCRHDHARPDGPRGKRKKEKPPCLDRPELKKRRHLERGATFPWRKKSRRCFEATSPGRCRMGGREEKKGKGTELPYTSPTRRTEESGPLAIKKGGRSQFLWREGNVRYSSRKDSFTRFSGPSTQKGHDTVRRIKKNPPKKKKKNPPTKKKKDAKKKDRDYRLRKRSFA